MSRLGEVPCAEALLASDGHVVEDLQLREGIDDEQTVVSDELNEERRRSVGGKRVRGCEAH